MSTEQKKPAKGGSGQQQARATGPHGQQGGSGDSIHTHHGANTGSVGTRDQSGPPKSGPIPEDNNPVTQNAGSIDQMGEHGSHRTEANKSADSSNNTRKTGPQSKVSDAERERNKKR